MKFGKIEKARTTMLNAGTAADRNQLRKTLMSHLAKDTDALRQQMASVRADYRRKLERWRTQEISHDVCVSAIPSDMHDSKLYRLTGVFALCCEMALAAWIFFWLGIGWWMGIATALGITLTLHGIFLHIFDNQERPKEAIYRLRTRASQPAIVGFLIALAVGVLARYVHGSLAVLLLPAFSFALWLGTLSLLILAASLFTVAHIQGWSARHQREYEKLEDDERVTSVFLEELRAEEKRTEARVEDPLLPGNGVPANFAGTLARRAIMFLFSGVLALAMTSATGCATPVRSASVQETGVARDTGAATLNIFVDTSGSCVQPALAEAWDTIQRELPELVEQHHINRFNIWQFDEDGWSPRRVRQIVLPSKDVLTPRQVPGTEWESLGNIRDAVREAADQDLHNRVVAAQEDYRNKLRSALAGLDREHILPSSNHETARTDIVGLLRRVSQSDDRSPHYILILSDLTDTHYRNFPKLPRPRDQIRVLVFLVPAQPRDAKMTWGKALTGSEQFGIRKRQLQDAAPWITVTPYFANDLSRLLSSQ